MKIRLQNSKSVPLRVILEPWASETLVAPDAAVWVIAEGDVPADAYIDVASSDEDLVVTPEWTGAIAYLCNDAGEKLD